MKDENCIAEPGGCAAKAGARAPAAADRRKCYVQRTDARYVTGVTVRGCAPGFLTVWCL